MIHKIIKGNVVLHNAIRLAKVAKLLNIPIISSKHAKRGKHNSALTEAHSVETTTVFTKTAFSMLAEKPIHSHFESLKRTNVVLYGGETHSSVL